MDALLSAFLAALLAEQGDASQLLAATIASRFGARPAVVAGVALAIALNAALAAAGGAIVHGLVPHRARLLLMALALIAAGAAAPFAAKPRKVELYPKLGGPAAAFVATLVLGFGDKTQFLTFAFAARYDAPVLAGLGACAGTLAGIAPALALGARLGRTWPLRPLRWTAAGLFLAAGIVVGLSALRLI